MPSARNNLAALRHRHGWTQAETATKLSTTRNTYAKLESGARQLSTPWIDKLAGAFGVDPSDLFLRRQKVFPSAGMIQAGGIVEWSPNYQAGAGEARLQVGEGSLGLLFDGWGLIFAEARIPHHQIVDGETYVVVFERGPTYVRRVFRQQNQTGVFILAGQGIAPSFNESIRWAHAILGLRRSTSAVS